jgi:hypothetical protein
MGPSLGLCGCFYPSFAVDRTMSLRCLFSLFRAFYYGTKYNTAPHAAPRGSAPNCGTGSRSWPWGAPPGGSPGPTRHRAPIMVSPQRKQGPGGVLGGGPPRAPPRPPPPPPPPSPPPPPPPHPAAQRRAPGASGGGRGGAPRGPPGAPPGARPGGAPRGGPRGGPPGGHFWGVRTRWGQNHAQSSVTVVYRGGRGAPPKAHWVRSLQGGPNRAQF